MLTESKVKSDLRNLRYFNNSVKIFERASKYFVNQYNLAKQNGYLTKDELISLENCIKFIDSNTFVKQSIEQKEKYMRAINMLDSFTKAIIVDAFINDCTYTQISQKMYCSEETVKRRVKSGISDILDIMNNLLTGNNGDNYE